MFGGTQGSGGDAAETTKGDLAGLMAEAIGGGVSSGKARDVFFG